MKNKILILLFFGFILRGCAGVSSSGIFGTGVSVAIDPRSLGTQIDDSLMQKNLTARILLLNKNYLLSVKSKVLDGRIFLTGKVDEPEEKLKLTKLEKYIFAKFPVTGYKISLKNFDENIDKIYLHEETLKEVNFNEEIEIASLDPIIATVSPNFLVNEDSKELDINNFYLLDGHHRVEYAKSKNLIQLLNCVLVNYDDVIIKPYDYETNLDLSEFISILNDNNFTESQEGSFNIKISNKIFMIFFQSFMILFDVF